MKNQNLSMHATNNFLLSAVAVYYKYCIIYILGAGVLVGPGVGLTPGRGLGVRTGRGVGLLQSGFLQHGLAGSLTITQPAGKLGYLGHL